MTLLHLHHVIRPLNTRPFKGSKSLNLGSWSFGWKVLQPFPLLAFKLVIWGPGALGFLGHPPKMNPGILRIISVPAWWGYVSSREGKRCSDPVMGWTQDIIKNFPWANFWFLVFQKPSTMQKMAFFCSKVVLWIHLRFPGVCIYTYKKYIQLFVGNFLVKKAAKLRKPTHSTNFSSKDSKFIHKFLSFKFM